jgi:hypothetical protein
MRRDAPGIEYLGTASLQLFGMGIGRANDDARLTTHSDILRCYDLAITMAKVAANTLRSSSEDRHCRTTSRREAL